MREHHSVAASDEPLLVSQEGGAFSNQTIQQVFRQPSTLAGIEGASSHSGRRTMPTKLAENGVHARVIQEIRAAADLLRRSATLS